MFKNDVVSAFQKKTMTTYVIRDTKFVNKIVHFNVFLVWYNPEWHINFSYLYITFIWSLIYIKKKYHDGKIALLYRIENISHIEIQK